MKNTHNTPIYSHKKSLQSFKILFRKARAATAFALDQGIQAVDGARLHVDLHVDLSGTTVLSALGFLRRGVH